MVHSETSTGVLNDIRALAATVRETDDTLVLVDSVSGLAAAEMRPDDWGVDFLLTGSQKALALPPGLAFGVASARMMERAATAPNRGYYFDLSQFQSNWEKDQSPSTPALSGLFALQVQLGRMLEEGMEARWARHSAMASMTWTWVEEMRDLGLDLFAPFGRRSPAVTAIRTARMSGPEITAAMKARGWVIGGGYGKTKEGAFRIGHMGEKTPDDVALLLEALAEVLR